MNNSLIRICLVLFTSFILVGFTLDDVLAEEKKITSQSFSFENTSIIEFTNNGIKEIKTIRIWLVDSSLNSFKSENGWISTITPQKVIVFTALEPLKTNETVKFGIKTENSNPLIQWEALDKEGNNIDIGKTQSQTIRSFVSSQEQSLIDDMTGILSESTFKVVPKNSHPGSTIRITGDNFAPNYNLKLFLSDTQLKSFETDENGHFMLTIKIPKKINAEQINFVLKDKQENEKTTSLYLTEIKQKIPENIDFTVFEIQNEFSRTDKIEFSGTASPDVPIIIKVKNPRGDLFSTKIKKTDSQGYWFASIYILPTAQIGKYSAEITDGKSIIIKSLDIFFSKNIHIFPTKLKFKSEEIIKFNGTANPGEQIDIKLIDPQRNEVLSKNFIVNPSGFFEIEYPTLSSSSKGTYILYAFQEHETEIIFVGLDEYPKKTLSAKLNNVNYRAGDVATIGITGANTKNLKLLILDQNGNEKFSDKIEIGRDGKINYPLNLTRYSTGVYTLLVSISSLQISEVFTVGLQPSSIPITLDMSKNTYNPGQSIFMTGKFEPNTLVYLLLIDPDGFIINEKESFVNKNGNLPGNNFMIPNDAAFGKWIVRAESVLHSANFEFQVNPSEKEEQGVRVTDIFSSSAGKFITIDGFVIEEQMVEIIIEDPYGNAIFKTHVRTTETGEFNLLWKVPPEHVSGTYSVIVIDSFEQTTSTIFDL